MNKMPFHNEITDLFRIQFPVIQAGMVWASGWRLASAVSNAGGLGLIGSGSMTPETLQEHIRKCKAATRQPFGVNIPLLYSRTEQLVQVTREEEVGIVFTSAGNPATWTKLLKDDGITVVHVVSSSRFAAKSEAAGCDAVVAEGFEAGGHNGREETTTMVLVPAVAATVGIPVIAAGGIGTGRQMAAAFALGASGVQVGSRFVASTEASSHPDFKQAVIESREGDTRLSLKKLAPVRLLKNKFFEQVLEAEQRGASQEELSELLGRGRSRKGMFEGHLDEGELEIGQVSALLKEILPAETILQNLWKEYLETCKQLGSLAG